MLGGAAEASRAVPLTGVAPVTGKNIRGKKEKNTPTARDIPLGNTGNSPLIPLTNFTAVVGEIGWQRQCPQLIISYQTKAGAKSISPMGLVSRDPKLAPSHPPLGANPELLGPSAYLLP